MVRTNVHTLNQEYNLKQHSFYFHEDFFHLPNVEGNFGVLGYSASLEGTWHNPSH